MHQIHVPEGGKILKAKNEELTLWRPTVSRSGAAGTVLGDDAGRPRRHCGAYHTLGGGARDEERDRIVLWKLLRIWPYLCTRR